jgi:hypothetical protein
VPGVAQVSYSGLFRWQPHVWQVDKRSATTPPDLTADIAGRKCPLAVQSARQRLGIGPSDARNICSSMIAPEIDTMLAGVASWFG